MGIFMRTEIYVQARMGSTRLPGKVMKTVMGKPLLEFLIERLKRVKHASALAVLTTTNHMDEVIVKFCSSKGILCYRGPEDDVLTRYHQVALERHPDAIVRITADCPLMDPEIVDKAIQMFVELQPKCDYLSNSMELTYPRGMDVEVFSFDALDQAFTYAKELFEREHVTPYFYRHPELFKLKNIISNISLAQHRWTVDTAEDFTLIKLILENLYQNNPNFNLADILFLLGKHPDWNQINAHIQQKTL